MTDVEFIDSKREKRLKKVAKKEAVSAGATDVVGSSGSIMFNIMMGGTMLIASTEFLYVSQILIGNVTPEGTSEITVHIITIALLTGFVFFLGGLAVFLRRRGVV